ncbi:unnamed protein product, partial [Polarella glacialis]
QEAAAKRRLSSSSAAEEEDAQEGTLPPLPPQLSAAGEVSRQQILDAVAALAQPPSPT